MPSARWVDDEGSRWVVPVLIALGPFEYPYVLKANVFMSGQLGARRVSQYRGCRGVAHFTIERMDFNPRAKRPPRDTLVQHLTYVEVK